MQSACPYRRQTWRACWRRWACTAGRSRVLRSRGAVRQPGRLGGGATLLCVCGARPGQHGSGVSRRGRCISRQALPRGDRGGAGDVRRQAVRCGELDLADGRRRGGLRMDHRVRIDRHGGHARRARISRSAAPRSCRLSHTRAAQRSDH